MIGKQGKTINGLMDKHGVHISVTDKETDEPLFTFHVNSEDASNPRADKAKSRAEIKLPDARRGHLPPRRPTAPSPRRA